MKINKFTHIIPILSLSLSFLFLTNLQKAEATETFTYETVGPQGEIPTSYENVILSETAYAAAILAKIMLKLLKKLKLHLSPYKK